MRAAENMGPAPSDHADARREGIPFDPEIDDRLRRVFEYVKANPGSKSLRVANGTGIPKRSAQRYLAALVKVGWIRSTGAGRLVRYYEVK